MFRDFHFIRHPKLLLGNEFFADCHKIINFFWLSRNWKKIAKLQLFTNWTNSGMETIIFDHISVKHWAFTGTLGWLAIRESDWITTRRQPIKYLRLFNWTFWNLLLYISILRALSLTVSILASWNRTRQDPRKKSKICHFVLGNDTQRF